MDAETGPTLAPTEGVDLAAYKGALIDRFANPAIRDTVERIGADAPVSLLLDPLKDRLAAGAPIYLLALGLAAWCRRVKMDAERPFEDRPMGKAELLLQPRARANDDPITFLGVEDIFGPIGRDPRLVSQVDAWLRAFEDFGAPETLKRAGDSGAI